MKQELYACVRAGEFPAQALLRLRPELRTRACVVMEGLPPLEEVCARNARARRLGVEYGMTRVEVETFPNLAVLARSLEEEAATQAVLLECAGSFSPRVEECSQEAVFRCVLDIAGTEKLFGPPERLARTLLDRIEGLGIAASVAVSRNFHAAVVMAAGLKCLRKSPDRRRLVSGHDFSRADKSNQTTRALAPEERVPCPNPLLTQTLKPEGHICVIPAVQESEMLAPLPVSILDLAQEQADTFASWGIETLGMLAALPEKELIARLGQEGQRLRQLARGERPHLFLPVEPPFALAERMELDAPVELLDSLLFVIGAMLEQLILRAQARILSLAAVTVTLSLEGGATHARTVRPALPSCDKQLWIKLLHLDLEAHPPNAAILGVTVTAEPGKTGKVQLGLFSPELPEPSRLDVTLARIRALVGEGNCGRAVLEDTHAPDAFRMEPFAVPASSKRAQAAPPNPRLVLRRLRPPVRTFVTQDGDKPASFAFRERRYTVERAYGPWASSGEWWNQSLWGVEEWDVVARAEDGSLLCCSLTRDPAGNVWEVAALYD